MAQPKPAAKDGRKASGTTHQTHLLVVVSLREDRILDRALNAERKRQLAVYEFASGQTAEEVGEKPLVGGDLRGAAIVELVRAGHADTAGAINIDAVAID